MAERIQLLAIILAISISVGYARSAKKIINGQTASMGEFPHQVSLQTVDGQSFCSGSIITSTLILTAAHCIIDEKKLLYINDIYAVVGTNNIKERTSETVFRVIRRIINDYNHSDSFHDIAILKLHRPIHSNKSNSVGVAVLGTYDVPAGTRVMSSGWGATEYDTRARQSGNSPQFLKKLERVVFSQQMCQYALRSSSKIGPGQICVWSPTKAAVCTGDSGGPLTYNGMVIGIASFVIPCAKGYPDVYTKVSYYTDWILKVTEIMNNNWTVPYNDPLIVEV